MGDYENWSLYPQASMNWMPSERHILQLNFSSDKEYPAYWEMQGAISYIDGYSEIHGTPGLRPSRSYEAQAVYIYRQKYIFVLFWNERPDYFTQAAWQASDRLAMIYQSLNWNFNRQWGANAVIPFRAGKWLNSRLTLTGMRMRQKCDPFHDMSFDRAKWVGIARLVNTFHLSRKPAIDLEVNGFFQSGGHSGHLRHQSPRFGRCRIKMDFRPEPGNPLRALQRPLRQPCALDEGTLPRAVARHGGATLHAHRNRTLLLPLRRLQGQKKQGGRYLALRTLNGPECHESFKTSEDAAASRFGRSDGCWKRACRVAGNSL